MKNAQLVGLLRCIPDDNDNSSNFSHYDKCMFNDVVQVISCCYNIFI